MLVGSLCQGQNASPRRQANLRQPKNPEGEGPGYDRTEELRGEELAAVEGCTPPKHRRYEEGAGSNAGIQRNSPMIAAMPLGPGQGTSSSVIF